MLSTVVYSSNICLSETAYQHKGTRSKCKKTNQAAIIQWQRKCLKDKPHRKPWPKSKTSNISKQSPSLLHHTFLLGCARFTAQPLSALIFIFNLNGKGEGEFFPRKSAYLELASKYRLNWNWANGPLLIANRFHFDICLLAVWWRHNVE